MKKILLLTICLISLNGFSQTDGFSTFNIKRARTAIVDPSYKYIPIKNELRSRAGDTACTTATLNMAFNYMVWADLQGYNLRGNWYQTTPSVLASLVSTNQVPGNDNNNFQITMKYDTMITRVLGLSSFEKINKANSFIRLDSLTIFGGLQVPDTNNLRNLVGDSLILSVYLTNGAGTLGAKVFDSIYDDTFKLKKFLFQGQFVGSRKINFKHQFNKGESFAIRMTYKTTKVDNGYTICYGAADSCGQINVGGQNFTSPPVRNGIYPGMVEREVVDSTSPTTANLVYSNNNYVYSFPGVPQSCSYVYEQVYYIIPQIIVCKELQGSIALSNDRPCYKDQTIAYAIVSGGKPPYTYSWTATGGTTLSTTNLDSAIFVMTKAGNITLNVTVTDNGVGGANQIVLTRTIGNFTPTFNSFTLTPNKTVLTSCADSVRIQTPSFATTTYQWSGGSSSNTREAIAKSPGVYSVKLTFLPSSCAFDTSITITSTASLPTLDFAFTPSTNICPNRDVEFKVATSSVRSGWTYRWTESSTSLASNGETITHKFTSSGIKSVKLNADSSVCKATEISKNVTVLPATDTKCKVAISIADNDNLKIFPNPVRDGKIYIQNDMNLSLSYRVTDMLGKVISAERLISNKDSQIDLSNAPNGIYFIEVESKGEKMIKKIIVDKQ
jgi:hypothetical protein